MIVDCCVCGETLNTEDAHTFHSEECPLRDEPDYDPAAVVDEDELLECIEYGGCGRDCHPECCPSCT